MKCKKLLFVGGFPSGGTELLKNILNAHPEIYITNEMPFLTLIEKSGYKQYSRLNNLEDVEEFRQTLKKNDLYNCLKNIDHDFNDEFLNSLKTDIEDVLFTLISSKNVLIKGIKTPQFTERLDIISKLFPQAFFLIVIRDVRDVCLSWQKKWGKNKLCCASKWMQRMKVGFLTAQRDLKDKCLFIKYEDLLNKTRTSCEKICKFLELSLSERMLEHHKYVVNKIDGKINYGEEIKRDNYKKWKSQLNSKTVQRIEEIAFNSLKIYGYMPEFADREVPIKPHERVCGKFGDLYAMLFIGNRKLTSNRLRNKIKTIQIEIKKRF